MTVSIFLANIVFLTLIQAAIPRLLKKSIVFGVTIPEVNVEDQKLSTYKKIYSAITLLVGLIGILLFAFLGLGKQLQEEKIVITGLIVQFSILFVSMILYLYFHIQTTKRKRKMKWGENLKKVRVADLARRSNDEMLPSIIFALPMAITIGLIVYTISQYSAMPDMIPTHWGPNGQPDAFTEKNPFSVIALLLILLVMQGMMVAINTFTKKSGVKLNATKRNTSRIQQLSFRKYTSWFMFLTTILLTILFGFFQLTTIHGEFAGSMMMMVLPLAFLLVILLATALYAFKVGQGGSRIRTEVIDEETTGITDLDDDQYWKAGVFYVNKNDPSIFVEKRFGVGWTINFGNPIGYLILIGPLLIIFVISFLL
ncbi:DUF1648 domain-containing protein [Sporosarcina highlanderae]|uniref:DUF5808 domain-containing protein n=1 Tax=Sporosarcina highlanderae TaxID=3035916 RepID=A0ABT8JQ45_9BACL|nr:DUF5808 domain-containing protein [Sporosarcina highlanderae]MDN4607263.1 DUF5808 domain-containing protein [Sporosarcina highlanderae]